MCAGREHGVVELQNFPGDGAARAAAAASAAWECMSERVFLAWKTSLTWLG